MQPTSRYSPSFFDTFAATIPADNTALEVAATARLAPPATHPRLLDIGCGTGRVTAGLAAAGFEVTGIDASIDALHRAQTRTPGGRFVALDYRHVGAMRWRFDVVTSYWNSLGFGQRSDDIALLESAHALIDPGGRLLLDLYHPDWLASHQIDGVSDPRGAVVHRWLESGRSCHRFEYADGTVDDIRFHVYHPDEMAAMLARAGFVVEQRLVWWSSEQLPSAASARYEIVGGRP
jgi:SAM-dependent methyltransferase